MPFAPFPTTNGGCIVKTASMFVQEVPDDLVAQLSYVDTWGAKDVPARLKVQQWASREGYTITLQREGADEQKLALSECDCIALIASLQHAQLNLKIEE